MIKLKFKGIDYPVKGRNEYKDIGGLPVNIVLDRAPHVFQFDTYYIFGNDFFIEFRFCLETKVFNQVAFVCLGQTSNKQSNDQIYINNEGLFQCYLDDIENKSKEIHCDIIAKIIGKNIVFLIKDYFESKIYYVADNLAFRIDQNNCLCEIIVIAQMELIQSFNHLDIV